MRRRIILLAVGVLVAGPAAAGDLSYGGPPESGQFYAPTPMHAAQIELGVGGATDGHTSITQIDGVGRLAGPLSNWLKGEGEVIGAGYFSGSNSIGLVGAAGHLYRDSATHAVGVFAGVSRLDNIDLFMVGGEAKKYFAQTALTGQVALITAQGANVFTGNGKADHYFTPDHKGTAMLAYYKSDSASLWLAGLGFEKRFSGTDWGMAVQGSYLRATGADGIWTGRIALKKYFDAPGVTLEQHDRLVPFSAVQLATIGR